MTDWKPPFCGNDAEELKCPACSETGSVRVRDHETYRDGDDYEAYCAECHARLIVYASVDVAFSDPEVDE